MCRPSDGRPRTTSPASTREPSITLVALDEPDARAREVELLLAVDAGHLRRLAAEERATRGAAGLRGSLDELRDLLERDLVPDDVVEEEERLGSGRDHVVHAVGGQVGADRAQPPGLAREHELRARAVHRGREEPLLVERVEAREGAESLRARRFDSGTQPFDDRIGERERDPRGLVRLTLHLQTSLRASAA